jgi:hypothetical protein
VLEDETTQTLENHAIDKIGPLIRRVGIDRLEYM